MQGDKNAGENESYVQRKITPNPAETPEACERKNERSMKSQSGGDEGKGIMVIEYRKACVPRRWRWDRRNNTSVIRVVELGYLAPPHGGMALI